MARYAQRSSVTTDRSEAEIKKTLLRFGADAYLSGQSRMQAFVQFCYQGRTIRMAFDLPDRDACGKTDTGRQRRSKKVIEAAYERELREQWRALALMVKAKLVACAQQLTTLEKEFLAYTVMPNGKTLYEIAEPTIDRMLETGKMPQALLPGLTE